MEFCADSNAICLKWIPVLLLSQYPNSFMHVEIGNFQEKNAALRGKINFENRAVKGLIAVLYY